MQHMVKYNIKKTINHKGYSIKRRHTLVDGVGGGADGTCKEIKVWPFVSSLFIFVTLIFFFNGKFTLFNFFSAYKKQTYKCFYRGNEAKHIIFFALGPLLPG